jgi:hypothetical protein
VERRGGNEFCGLSIGSSFFGYPAVVIVFSKPTGLMFYLGSAAILCWTWPKMIA